MSNKTRCIALFIFLFFSRAGISQRIVNYQASVLNDKVSLKFTVTEGFDCGGYQVYRAPDSLNFIQIHDYAGICGNTTTKTDFSYTDQNPVLNGDNYYRIKLNGFETSSILKVFVSEPNETNLFLYPNPVYKSIEYITVKISGSNYETFSGFVYNQMGQMIRSFNFVTEIDIWRMLTDELENGLYTLKLNGDSKMYTSKFIILR